MLMFRINVESYPRQLNQYTPFIIFCEVQGCSKRWLSGFRAVFLDALQPATAMIDVMDKKMTVDLNISVEIR